MKTTQILKAIAFGILAGAVLFFIPFPFRFFFGFFLIFFIIRAFAWRSWRGHGRRNFGGHYFWNPSYTQRWQNMSEEERKTFVQKMESELFKTNIASE